MFTKANETKRVPAVSAKQSNLLPTHTFHNLQNTHVLNGRQYASMKKDIHQEWP